MPDDAGSPHPRPTHRLTIEQARDELATIALRFIREPMCREIISAGCEDYCDLPEADIIAGLADELAALASLLPG